MINPDGVRHQIHGNVIQSTSRALMEEVPFERATVAAREWGAYPIINFPDVPKIDVLMLPRPDQPPLGVGESASVPSAAAIANAIFDATGVRFREPPFTPERILRGFHGEHAGARKRCPRRHPQLPRRQVEKSVRQSGRRVRGARRASARPRSASAPRCCRGARSRRSRGPIHRSYSAATIARGQQLAALGDCAVCHTSLGGALNAGGRALETPFGIIYSTNITPDVETGIGTWSYPAFERAMREGIHRDGQHLYPAFPYTHFAKATDADLQALYAYLMAQPPVRARDAGEHARLPVQPAAAAGGLECAVPLDASLPARSRQIRAVESRRLSRRRSRPLQRLPFAAQRTRRGNREPLSRRRICRGLGSAGADLALARADPVERGRALRLSAHRPIALPRRRGRTDGAGRQGTEGAARPGHPRHGGLSRLVQRRRAGQAGAEALATRLESATLLTLPPPPPARGSIKAPARSAMRSAAPRCSAAGRRCRSTAICTATCPTT